MRLPSLPSFSSLPGVGSYFRNTENASEESFMSEIEKEMSLSYKKRLILFVSFLGLGILLCFLVSLQTFFLFFG